jgi:pSer/pThr/pTyr-binding forkhead associated (FHA) protein
MPPVFATCRAGANAGPDFPDEAMDVRLLVIKGSRKTREIALRARETIIGRQTGCGLRIPSATVSRRHCRLSIHGSSVTIEDLGSANGCFLNGARVRGVEILRPGDQLEIGPVAFVVEFRAHEPAPQQPAPPADDWVQAVPMDETPPPSPAAQADPEITAREDVPLVLESEDDWQLSVDEESGETP